MRTTSARELFGAANGGVMKIGTAHAIDRGSGSPPVSGAGMTKYLTRIAARAKGRIVLVSLRDVVWIQSHRNFLRLHLQMETYERRMTLHDIHEQLDPEQFFRIHRGAIVNLDHVIAFYLSGGGNGFAHLGNGTAVPISRAIRRELRRGLFSNPSALTLPGARWSAAAQ